MGPLEVHVASTYDEKINTPNSINNRGEGGILKEQGDQK